MATTQSKWRSGLKTLHDKTFKQLDRVGVQVNKASGKLGMESFWPGPMPREIEKATRILNTFTANELLETADPIDKKKTQKVLVKIPPSFIRDAQGLAIFTVFRSGLGFSAASGSGVVIARDSEGTWGPPSGILIHTLGFGFLAGVDVYDVVLILRNRRAVKAFANPKVSLGAELSVAAGPLGTGAMVNTGIEAAPVLSYVKSKGLYGGVQVDGNVIVERKDENRRFYGRPIKASEILDLHSRTEVPAGSEPLHIAIAAAEGLISTAQLRYRDRDIQIQRRVPPTTMATSSSAQRQDSTNEDIVDADEYYDNEEEEAIFDRRKSLDEKQPF